MLRNILLYTKFSDPSANKPFIFSSFQSYPPSFSLLYCELAERNGSAIMNFRFIYSAIGSIIIKLLG